MKAEAEAGVEVDPGEDADVDEVAGVTLPKIGPGKTETRLAGQITIGRGDMIRRWLVLELVRRIHEEIVTISIALHTADFLLTSMSDTLHRQELKKSRSGREDETNFNETSCCRNVDRE